MKTTIQREPAKKLEWARGLGALLCLAVMLGLGALFAVVAEDVWLKETFAWDALIALAIHQFSTPLLDRAMDLITQFGELGAIAAAFLVIAWCARRRRLLDATAFMLSFGGAIALNTVLKALFARPRPTYFPPLVFESGYSFPSGHILASMALYGLLGVLLWRQHHRLWALLCGVLILLISFSRVYLGVHFPSDVLASLSLGTLWLCIVLAARHWAGVCLRAQPYLRTRGRNRPDG